MYIQKVKNLHLVGIGGSGMCGIAEVLLNMGYRVSGSDILETGVTERIRVLGGRIEIGHAPENVGDAQFVVTSSAIRSDNPEVVEARKKKIPVIPRAEMLGELMRMKYSIGVAGAHGKTTTTSIVAAVLEAAGLDPTAVVGGRLAAGGSNARLGQGEFLVAEADESDGSFLQLTPTWALITNIDREHLDFYPDEAAIREAFISFANKVPFYGAVILGVDCGNVREIMPRIKKRTITYALREPADVTAKDIEYTGSSTSFTVQEGGRELGRLTTGMPGEHNVANSLAAVAVALELDLPPEKIIAGLESFRNTHRRFELKGEIRDVMVVDDYGHHPAEIRATLAAAAAGWERRIVAVFQPHRYSRTQALLDEFVTAFDDAAVVVLTGIYAAGEDRLEGVTAENIYHPLKARGKSEVHYVTERRDIAPALEGLIHPGDMVITMGAGDIWKSSEELCRLLEGERR